VIERRRKRNRSRQVSLFVFTALAILASSPAGQAAGDTIAEEVTFTNGDLTLSGTLTLPSAGAPHPAVLLIGGSGPQDRDGAMRVIPGYRPFALMAEHLTREGVAVLRYDERGVGKSTGNYGAATEPDFIEDVEAAFQYLLSRQDIAAERTGILGLSEGAMIAAIVAGKSPQVSFVISLGGGAVDGRSLLLRQTERQAEATGMSKEEVARVVQEQRRIFDLVLAKKWEDLRSAVEETTLSRLKALPKERTAVLGDPHAVASRKAAASVRVFQHPRYQFVLGHDFGEDWAKVSVPVLALFGELDVQCDASQNKVALKQALARGGNDDVTIVVVPAANHLFMKAETGSMSEYATLPKEFAPDVLESISNWLRQKDENARGNSASE
jgi:pimeloyl-ACP methyl ester carboxylesterase